MENARNQESRNRDGRNAATATDFSGNAIDNGNGLRTDDGNESSIDVGHTSGQSGATKLSNNDVRSVSADTGVEITDGFYFTPRGTIERIPIGYYISPDGKLRKRRKSKSVGSDANGNAHRNRSETGEETASVLGDTLPVDKPLNIRGGKKRGRKPKEETNKLTMVTMLASGAAMLFTSVALLTKHDHWNLETEEAKTLAEALNEAISTLPEKYYAQIIAIIEKWVPWFNLAFVVGAIVIPRIEASSKRIEKSHTRDDIGNHERDARTKDNPFSDFTSLGWNG